jgi:hypothetical protein
VPGTEIARAYGLRVLILADTKIAEIRFFADSGVFPHFGLPRSVPKQREQPIETSADRRD